MGKYYATWQYDADYHAAIVSAEDMTEALVKIGDFARETNPDEEPDNLEIRRM